MPELYLHAKHGKHGKNTSDLVKQIIDITQLAEEAKDCTRCPLHKTRQNVAFAKGNPDAKLLIISEAPGRDEDIQGIPFVGRSGQLLDKILLAADMTLDDVYIINIIKCRPPQNRNPTLEETMACHHWLRQQLQELQPRCILLLGKVAAQHMLAVDTQTTLASLRVAWHTIALEDIPITMRQVPVRVSYHPAYLLRNPAHKGQAWQDWLQIMQYLNN